MDWQPAQRYPDPAVVSVDPFFRQVTGSASPRWSASPRAAAGPRGRSGSAIPGSLLWSDIPNNRILRWDEETGAVSVFRKPSNNANGHTRDRQGRIVACEHGGRRVTRTEHDGTITVVADSFEGKRLNSPNDVVVKSDGSIWFTDPTFGILGWYEGGKAAPESGDERVSRRRLGQQSRSRWKASTSPTAWRSRPTKSCSTSSSRARCRARSSPMTSWTAASSPTAAC